MKKSFVVEDLCCAHCAAEMEEAVKKVDGVISANVNFILQKITVEAADDEFDAVMKKVVKVCKKVEPDATIKL